MVSVDVKHPVYLTILGGRPFKALAVGAHSTTRQDTQDVKHPVCLPILSGRPFKASAVGAHSTTRQDTQDGPSAATSRTCHSHASLATPQKPGRD